MIEAFCNVMPLEHGDLSYHRDIFNFAVLLSWRLDSREISYLNPSSPPARKTRFPSVSMRAIKLVFHLPLTRARFTQ